MEELMKGLVEYIRNQCLGVESASIDLFVTKQIYGELKAENPEALSRILNEEALLYRVGDFELTILESEHDTK